MTRQTGAPSAPSFQELSELIKLTHVSCSGTENSGVSNLGLDQLGVQGRTLLNLLRETLPLIVSRLRTEVQQVGDLHCVVTRGGFGDIMVSGGSGPVRSGYAPPFPICKASDSVSQPDPHGHCLSPCDNTPAYHSFPFTFLALI